MKRSEISKVKGFVLGHISSKKKNHGVLNLNSGL